MLPKTKLLCNVKPKNMSCIIINFRYKCPRNYQFISFTVSQLAEMKVFLQIFLVLLSSFSFSYARHGKVEVYESFCPDNSKNEIIPSPSTPAPVIIISQPQTAPPQPTRSTTPRPQIYPAFPDVFGIVGNFLKGLFGVPSSSTMSPIIVFPATPAPQPSNPPTPTSPPVIVPPTVAPTAAPTPIDVSGNCPACIAGQGVLPYDVWANLHFNRPGPPEGNCPGMRSKIIFIGNPNKCCCNPDNNPRSNK